MRLKLPFPPPVNNLYADVIVPRKKATIPNFIASLRVHGWSPKHLAQFIMPRRVKTSRARKYAEECAAAILPQIGIDHVPYSGRVVVELIVHPPDRRKRDMDGVPKALFDVFTTAAVWVDDSQVRRFSVEVGHVVRGGLVVVEITPDDNRQRGIRVVDEGPPPMQADWVPPF